MSTQVDHLRHLAQESARFAKAIRQAPPDAPVPTCPGWSADDLLWHLAKVQYFWGTVVREGLAGDKAGELTPERPGDRAGLLSFYEDASGRLARVLAATAPEAAAWTWALEQTAGARRMGASRKFRAYRSGGLCVRAGEFVRGSQANGLAVAHAGRPQPSEPARDIVRSPTWPRTSASTTPASSRASQAPRASAAAA